MSENHTTETGSGITYWGIVKQLREQSEKDYRAMLKPLGIKGKKLDDMCAGLNDGFGAAVRHLVAMGAISVQEDPK